MAKEICISTTPHETRLAILEDDQLAEIYYERENEYTLAGSIYKGRVTRVLPGMQSSFVDVGLERDAFLYVTDFLEEQEDSEEYASDGNGGGRREARSHAEPAGEEPQGRYGDRSGGERNGQDRNQERGERNGSERGHDRNADRGGRQPAAAVPQQAEAAREGGRAGRERAREQAVAPLREAVPAAQDLDEKGDEESPEGTRRWRGRRGRRRGVRGGLPKAESSTLLSQAEAVPVEAGSPDESETFPSPLPEAGAPGGMASLQAASPLQGEEPVRRSERGRDRRPRGAREPYAQASTLGRSGQDRAQDHAQHPSAQDRPGQDPSAEEAERPSLEVRSEARGDVAELHRASGGAAAMGGSIVLPGESLSKYGSAPADPSVPPVAATATVPKTVRPVNYVAPKPSTLVELPSDWDGGAVMPGETLSRYRGPAAAASPAQTAHLETSAPRLSEPVTEVESSREVESSAVHPGSFPYEEPLAAESTPEPFAAASQAPSSAEAAFGNVAEESEPGSVYWQRSQHDPAIDPMPLAEPEVVTAAVSPQAEAGAPHVAEPEFTHAPEPVGTEAQAEGQSEPGDYEPENASASYRVQRNAPSELRIPSPDVEEEAAHREAPETTHLPEAYAEPVGQLAGGGETHAAGQEIRNPVESHFEVPAEVTEFGGELAPATGVHAEPETRHVAQPEPWPLPAAPGLQILHADGTVDLAAAQEGEISFRDSEHTGFEASESPDGHGYNPHDLERQPGEPDDFERPTELSPAAEARQEEHEHDDEHGAFAGQSSEFADLVDRMQGFAPGLGLLEEETIDEEEYDFEPLHAHAEDGDQEDLEEETLDQHMEPAALSDAVRETHLEQRVQSPVRGEQVSEAAAFAGEEVSEEEEAGFGFEEVEEGDEDPEEEGEESVQGALTGEPQRADRPEDSRRRGRSGGRSAGRPGGRNGGRGRSAQTQSLPIISELLKQGQEILVQIAKEPIAKKGARITSHIALPGRFLVFMPTVSHVGVSRKIASDEERQRLKRILISEKADSSGGFIVRTAAEGASEEDLRADLRFLISLWTEIKQRADTAKAPALIYHDLNLIERILRDQVSSNFSTIWVDSEAEYERIIRFLNRFQPQLVRRVKLYTKETPLFEHFGIQEEISKALKSKVWLKSGGSIVINQTEALVAIDINTGKYVGKTSRLEDTIVKTNLDAIPEIVRQIRLRDLGGIIVIDFIDMDERKNRNKVLAALEEELKNDRAPSKVLQFNDFGLVAITRKRVKQSLERTLSVTCETCTGTGMVKSPITVCNEIYTEMRKMLKHLDGKDVMLRVHPEVVKQLKAGNGKWINELEEMVAKTIIIKSDPALHPEQFDIH